MPDRSEPDESERPYVAVASDGDMTENVTREEAFEWAEEHLAMLESLEAEGIDHWVQINSYRPAFAELTGGDS